jgi:hypothetical protein
VALPETQAPKFQVSHLRGGEELKSTKVGGGVYRRQNAPSPTAPGFDLGRPTRLRVEIAQRGEVWVL